jgi:hypothetical protein
MTLETASPVQERCSRCGSAHRPSYFERACRCPACGLPLQGELRREPFRIPRAYLAIGAAVVLGAGITGLAARSMPRRQPLNPVSNSLAAPRPTSSPTSPSTAFPARPERAAEFDPELSAVLQEKARVLEADLAAGPPDATAMEPMLLVALTETRLHQALVSRDVDHEPQAAQRSLRQAQAHVARLAKRNSFLALRLKARIDRFARLKLSNELSGSMAAILWPMETGRNVIFPPPLPVSGDMGFPGSPIVVMGGPGAPGTPPQVGSPPPYSPQSSWQPPHASPSNGPAGMPPAGTIANGPPPGFMPRVGSPPDAEPESRPPGDIIASDVPAVVAEPLLARARAEFAAYPANPGAAERLGKLLAPPGPRRRRRQPSELENPEQRARLEEAARVYRRAAERARLRVFRAAFYHAAARVYQRLEDWEHQHEVLKLATQAVPFSADLWSDLGKSALRTGNIEENQQAEARAKKRRLPAVRLDPEPGREWSGTPGGPAVPPPAPADALRR